MGTMEKTMETTTMGYIRVIYLLQAPKLSSQTMRGSLILRNPFVAYLPLQRNAL